MFRVITLFSLLFTASLSFAEEATLVCESLGGPTLTASESASGRLYGFVLSAGEVSKQAYPEAYAMDLIEENGNVEFLIVKDQEQGIVAVIANGMLYDASGSYTLTSCNIEL